MYDVASSILQQKISQVQGVGQVIVGGGALPAVRVEVNPTVAQQLRPRPGGRPRRARRPPTPTARRASSPTTGRLVARHHRPAAQGAAEYGPLIIAYRNGAAVRLGDVGDGHRLGRGRPHGGSGERQAGGRC